MPEEDKAQEEKSETPEVTPDASEEKVDKDEVDETPDAGEAAPEVKPEVVPGEEPPVGDEPPATEPPTSEKVDRGQPQFMTIGKHQSVVKKLTDKFQVDLEAARKGPAATPADNQAAVSTLAEKHNVPVEFVNELVAIVRPTDMINKLNDMFVSAQQTNQDNKFTAEYDTLVSEFPDAKDAKVKEGLRRMAFTKSLLTTPLRMIYLGSDNLKKPAATKTGESQGRGAAAVTGDNFQEIIDLTQPAQSQAIAALSQPQFEKFSNWLSTKSRSPMRRGGQPVTP